MTPTALTFLGSALVAAAFIPFSLYQGPRTSSAIAKLWPDVRRKSIRDDPRNVEAYVDQALDIAYGFPAVVLTVVAYADLSNHLAWVSPVTVILAVAITLLLVWFSSPKRVNLFLHLRVGRISALSVIVVVANIVGLALAFSVQAETTVGGN